jgi:hypothetical protein
MSIVSGKLTVCFEDPFWIGVYERIEEGRLSVAKVTFGAEPTEREVNDFFEKNFYKLKFSPGVSTVVKEIRKNPKSMLRAVRKQTRNAGIGTKSQQAIKLQQEAGKAERKVACRERKYAEEKRMFELKQLKKKDKHRGH